MGQLELQCEVKGPVQTNVYLGMHKETREAFLVDPADCADELAQWVRSTRATPRAILLTHGHYDHTGAAMRLKAEFQIPIYAMGAERALLSDAALNLSAKWGRGFTVKADRFLEDGETFSVAGFSIKAFHAPGHTKGGACYWIADEKVLFSGDTIFYESIGRTDLPTGNHAELLRTVREILNALPADAAIFPGHGEETTVAHELQYNPYV